MSVSPHDPGAVARALHEAWQRLQDAAAREAAAASGLEAALQAPAEAIARALRQLGLLEALTPVQRTLVGAEPAGHQLVLAGPGAGKTRVIAHRIAWLLQVRQVAPRQIVALAFNRGAAAELRQRLQQLVGETARGVTVLTHHAMALRLTGGRLAGSERDDAPIDFARLLDDAVAQLRGAAHPPQPAHLFVDEYQDMSPAQYALVAALTGPHTRLMAVGDDDQTIYGFGGASIEFIRRFRQDYAPVTTTFLVENFRSSAHILAVAARLIAPAAERMKGDDAPVRVADLRAHEPPGGRWQALDAEDGRGRVRLIDAPADATRQSALVLDEVRRLLRLDPALRPGDIAVLARTRRTLAALQALCLLEGLRCELVPRPQAPTRLTVLHTREGHRLLELLERADRPVRRSAGLVRWSAAQLRRRPGHPVWQDLHLLASELAAAVAPRLAATELVERLHELARETRRAGSAQALRLMTAHAAKGLEFRHVVVMDADDWLPGDDERRLLYVAATRAAETLALMRARPSRHGLLDDPGLQALEAVQRLSPPVPAGEVPAPRHMLAISPADIDLGHAGRMPPGHRLHRRLAGLEAGDPVRLIGRRIENARGELVGQLSRRAQALEQRARPPGLPGRVTAILVRHREQAGEAFRADLHCARWEVPLVEVVVTDVPPGEGR